MKECLSDLEIKPNAKLDASPTALNRPVEVLLHLFIPNYCCLDNHHALPADGFFFILVGMGRDIENHCCHRQFLYHVASNPMIKFIIRFLAISFAR